MKRLLVLALVLTMNSAVFAANEIVLGAAQAMSGSTATFGIETVYGMKMALEKINQKGLLGGRKIKLIVEDTKGEPVDTANAVRKLINIDKVSVIMGEVASSNTLAAAPIAQESKVPLISSASTNEKVTMAGDFISRICFTDDFQGVVLAKFAAEGLKKKVAATIVDNSSDYAKGLDKVFRKKFIELGGTIVKDNDFTYQQKDSDFRTLLKKVKRANPDVIFVPGYYTEVGLILRQAREMGITAPFLGGDGWESPKLFEIAGDKGIQGGYITSHYAADDQDPKVIEFVKEYKKMYGEAPGTMAALGYDVLMVVADAITRAGKSDPVAIKNAINATKGFAGVTGLITLNKDRNAIKSAVVLETVKGGVYKFVSRVNP
ncbi:MAG: ABC transporter substrate-binding protein [Bacteriovoracaceae bacterium]